MSSLMLQDTTNLLNAVGNLAGGFAQLHQTRVAVETQRRAVEIQSRQQELLKRQYLPDGDPNKLTLENWREQTEQFDSDIQSYLGELKDDKVRAGVQANLQNNANQFHLNLMQTYATLERQETQTLAVQTYQESLENGNDTQAIEMFQNHIAMGIWSPSQARDLEIKIFRPWLDNQNANAARNLATLEAEGNTNNMLNQTMKLLGDKSRELTTKDALTGKERPMNTAERNRAVSLLRQEQDTLNDMFLKQVMKEDFSSFENFVNANMAAGTWQQLDGFAEAMFTEKYGQLLSQEVAADVTSMLSRFQQDYGNGISYSAAFMLKDQLAVAFLQAHNRTHPDSQIDPANRDNLNPLMWRSIVADADIEKFYEAQTTIDGWKRTSGEEAGESFAMLQGRWNSELFDMLVNNSDTDGYLKVSYYQAVNLLNSMRDKYAGDPNSEYYDPRIHTWAMQTAIKAIEDRIKPDQDINSFDDDFVATMIGFNGSIGREFEKLFGKDPRKLQENLMKNRSGLGLLIGDILERAEVSSRGLSQDPAARRNAIFKEIEKAQKIWESDVGMKMIQDRTFTAPINSKEFQSLLRLGEDSDIDITKYNFLSAPVRQMGSILYNGDNSFIKQVIKQGKMQIPLGDGTFYTLTDKDMDKVGFMPTHDGNDFVVTVQGVKGSDGKDLPGYVFGVNVAPTSGVYLQRAAGPMGTNTLEEARTKSAAELQNFFWSNDPKAMIMASSVDRAGLSGAVLQGAVDAGQAVVDSARPRDFGNVTAAAGTSTAQTKQVATVIGTSGLTTGSIQARQSGADLSAKTWLDGAQKALSNTNLNNADVEVAIKELNLILGGLNQANFAAGLRNRGYPAQKIQQLLDQYISIQNAEQ